MEMFLENRTRNTPVQCLNDSEKQQLEIQRNETDMTANDIAHANLSPPTKTTLQIERRLVRDQITNEFYKPLSSTVVLNKLEKITQSVKDLYHLTILVDTEVLKNFDVFSLGGTQMRKLSSWWMKFSEKFTADIYEKKTWEN